MAVLTSVCKGVPVYRDGCRDGVLKKDTDRAKMEFESRSAPKRPQELTCDINHASIKGEDWTILIGLMNGRPYEVLGGLSEYVEIPRKYKQGRLIKRDRKSMPSKYDLHFGPNGEETIIKDVVSVYGNPNYSAFTRTISLALRHGVPIHYLVEQLQKDRDADLFSFSKVIARVLKKYIANGTKASNGIIDCNCESAEQCKVVYQEGCATCLSCGYAKCG